MPASWPAYAATRNAQEQIGPGVSYEHWSLGAGSSTGAETASADGPLSISIVAADLTNPFVSLTAAAQNGQVQGRGARLSAIADSVRAEAGVNGDYFDIGASNAPINALVIGRRVLHQPSDGAVLGIDFSGQVHLGPMTWSATVTPAGAAPLTVSTVNDWTASTSLTMLTPELGTVQAYGATEAVLYPTDQVDTYVVSSVAANLNSLAPLTTGAIGIAGHGRGAASISSTLNVGARVAISYEGDPPPYSIRAAIGGGPLLVRDGASFDDPAAPAPQEKNVRYPLTGAGVSADGRTLWLVVVDGRHPGVSVGVTRPMLGELFIAMGAANAMAFDSGGSSEMVVRHLGDPAVGVVNTPSDGRERSIADGLLILNTAPPGPTARLLIRMDAPAVLEGSRLGIHVGAVDQNLQPVAVPASSLAWRFQPNGALAVDNAGDLRARLPGTANVTVTSGAISTTSTVNVVSSIGGLSITGFGTIVQPGTTIQLSAAATDALGNPVSMDPSAVTWWAGQGASISPTGALSAGPIPAAVTVRASAAGAVATALVEVGDHSAITERSLPVGVAAGAWRFSASSLSAGGALDQNPAPDGSPAARLSFNFLAGSGTRAVYASSEVEIPNEPTAIACDIFGDGNDEWVRASYRNADGTVDNVTLARHVDWTGWRTVRAAVLPEVGWPIVLTRLYVVQPDKSAAHGAIWLRNVAGIYPGP